MGYKIGVGVLVKIINVLGLLLTIFFISPVSAEVCIDSVSSLNQHKSDLPLILRNLPVRLSVDSILVTAAISICSVGEDLKLVGNVWTITEIYEDENYIKKACFEAGIFTVTLQNGKTYEIKVESEKSLKIENVSFQIADKAKYIAVVNKINTAADKAAGRTTTGNGGRNGAAY